MTLSKARLERGADGDAVVSSGDQPRIEGAPPLPRLLHDRSGRISAIPPPLVRRGRPAEPETPSRPRPLRHRPVRGGDVSGERLALVLHAQRRSRPRDVSRRAMGPDARRVRPPSQDWCPVEPFWHSLGERGLPLVAYDVPFSESRQVAPNVVEIVGWGMHEGMWHSSRPPGPDEGDRDSFRRGEPAARGHRRTPPRWSSTSSPGLLDDVRQRTAVIEELATRYPWQVFMAICTEPHRAGHWYWGDAPPALPRGASRRCWSRSTARSRAWRRC